MLLKKMADDVKALSKALREPLPDKEFCHACAADALKFCTRLYGKPTDPQNSYQLFPGIRSSGSGCGYSPGRYTIFISPHLETREQLCADIGHEMYHRVTMRRQGFQRQLWFDEMMASVTSRWFLRSQGFSDYEKCVKDHYRALPGTVSVKALREVRYSTLRLPLRTIWQQYPIDFYSDVARLGDALSRVTDPNDLPPVINHRSLEEWVASLPQMDQYAVCRTLELPTEGKLLPDDKRLLDRLFYALYRKGEHEGTVTEFQMIAGLQPANGAAFYFLGRAYLNLNQYETALKAFSRATSLGFQDEWLPHFSGIAYQCIDDLSSAVRCFEEATQGNPERGLSYYRWGESLYWSGDVEGAQTAWEKVLTLEDEKASAKARRALENGLAPYSTT